VPWCAGDYARLNDVHALSHCNTCQIDFRVNFDHNVEVIFRPNQSVRTVDATVEFCVGSPQRQPHIAFSRIVPPREELPFSTTLNEGRYSLRSSQLSGAQILLATNDGAEKINLHVDNKEWPTGVTELGLMPYIRLINETDQAQRPLI
jgi:hypothetical protein